jgi:RNA polymerase sigma-70 factor (ECF subfamily)
LAVAVPVFRRFRLDDSDVDEATQSIRERLFVTPGPSGEPRITSYGGVAPLEHWVRAVAAREALGLLRRRRPEEPFDVDVLDETEDPHLVALKERYRADFRAAFQEAFASLTARDRAILKMILVDEAPVGQVAALYRVHRVTASRWLSSIRETLLGRTSHVLAERLGLSAADTESVIRLIDSHLSVSLHSLFGEGEDAARVSG